MMFDIETLDVADTAVVLQVGYVVFEGELTIRQRSFNLDAQEQLDGGRSVAWSTLEWWFKQSDDARKSVSGGSSYKMDAFMTSFAEAVKDVELIWAKGSFDFQIVENMYRGAGKKAPWRYSQPRDLRTALDFHPEAKKMARDGVGHTGLGDAMHQMRQLVAVRKSMKKGPSGDAPPAAV